MYYVDTDYAANTYAVLAEDVRELLRDRAVRFIEGSGIEPTETLVEEVAIHLLKRALNDYAVAELAIEEALGEAGGDDDA
jgi:hypothetical protein